jgi:hypothetical protein
MPFTVRQKAASSGTFHSRRKRRRVCLQACSSIGSSPIRLAGDGAGAVYRHALDIIDVAAATATSRRTEICVSFLQGKTLL